MEIRNFSLSIAKYFTSECSKRVKYFAAKGVYFHTNANEMPKHFKFFFFFFAAKGAIHCATITSVIFSFVKLKITMFLERFRITFTAK